MVESDSDSDTIYCRCFEAKTTSLSSMPKLYYTSNGNDDDDDAVPTSTREGKVRNLL